MKNKKKIELNIVIPIAKIDLNFDYEFGKATKDIIKIEEYKQTLIKHLYPNNLLEREINSYNDDY